MTKRTYMLCVGIPAEQSQWKRSFVCVFESRNLRNKRGLKYADIIK